MFAYISGKLASISPATATIDVGGVGYQIHISLHTYSKIQNQEKCRLFTFFYVKEDAQQLYGFADEFEKSLFVHLLSVSGIGPNTARMILSSYPPEEVRMAIISENVGMMESIKGIGPKSAKRLILELKDKLTKEAGDLSINLPSNNTLNEEALSALVMLGFSKINAERAINKVLRKHPDVSQVEVLIKEALKNM